MNEGLERDAHDEPVPLTLVEQSLGTAGARPGPTAASGPWPFIATVGLPPGSEGNGQVAVVDDRRRSDMEVDG
ncbi:hypothetical protein [Egicoccus sp. AB-alg2]|uniref:hypothetical protein n=1 Tax=Egicoccus sp. AB-alg2 TaxID=3242693 RepID=UPI00359E2149